MKKHDNPTNTNFWFGFALGSITLTAAAYLIGTKNGRERLKQLLEYADSVQDVPEEFFVLLPAIREMLNKNEEKQKKESDENKDESVGSKLNKSLDSLLEKVKHTAEEKNSQAGGTKKYFIKSPKE